MKLTEKPDFVTWPEVHYVYIEKIGPFQETAQKAWTELHAFMPQIREQNKVTGAFATYQLEPQMVYRAGMALAEKPKDLPAGMKYTQFNGGKFARFVLTGSYSNLPEACGRVFEIVDETDLPIREGAFFAENYANDPSTTPEDQLVTEILIPTT